MQQELVTLADTASAGKSLVEIFMKNQKYYTVETNHAGRLVDNAARNIEDFLKKRAKALEALATAAENFQMEHQWTEEFDENDIVYYNAKDNLETNETEGRKNRIRPEFKEDPAFKNRLISYNHTAVHIPTDIYDGSTIVLNELNWTEALEEVFKKNREEDPTLLWQVFGSATGLARYYPASPWKDARKTPSKIDLYDVRRRPWYVQGAASPKDMLILVDASGSVSGLTLKLIRTSVSEMLETLSDDDYVNVVNFNTKVNNTACFDHLVQANVRNKKILKDAVQNITAKGITNYTKGFEFAFKQLSDSNVSRANCNKIIMLFTDGGEERAQDIFKQYNNKMEVRIFTFSVGQHNYDTGPIQWMACNNKGYFYEIPSIGAIRINTQEYLDVLGRPMVLADAKQVQWTNVYLDALELGLVITGTLPVFNKTKSKENGSRIQHENQLILGVMGVDVSLDDIKRLTPRFTIGPNGYYFAIDPNGYVLLHPNLQPKNPKFQEPVTLDFLDAELENDIKVEIRTKMIDRVPGEQKKIETLVKSQDERYIDRGVRTYTWVPVNGTDYSLALVLPEYNMHYIQANLGDIEQAMYTMQVEKFEDYGYTFIAPREYCQDLKPSTNNIQFLMDVNQYIDKRTPNDPMCNVTLLNRLLLDAVLTAELVNLWKKQSVEGVLARFVATDGGITRVYPKRDRHQWLFFSENTESAFRTALSVLISPYEEYIDSVAATFMSLAVVGVKLNVSAWMNSFMNATMKINCKDEICGCLRNDKHVDCVILDDGGFLLMSNQEEYITQIGQFFGEVDPILMASLLNTSLYAFNKTYDFQSVCDPEKEPKAAAGPRSAYVPTVADMLSLGWWASTAAWSMLQHFLLSLTFPSFLHAEEDVSDAYSKESCITEQTQYFFENDNRSFQGVLDCGNCSRMYRAEKLPSTNLVFLITDAKSTCLSCDTKPVRQAEQPSTGPDPCILAHNPRYRKGPDVCFDNNIAEDVSDCGGGCSLIPSLWPVLVLQLLLLWLLTGTGCCS
ncbi:voltage-dependent calcium channel subunit alpha-2/delta-1 [Silurus asotus]|uniref:Voltage-dependent calcium channel subunit alpha-2/delta-1 n=1 Tax=Silurus asotus TaxID=30991 RepID=A0AAD5AVQ8_SILAS|nr:voltage-dependent calcium channel subunit alpha-2/delta-1 [Silurus asotus]